VTNGNVEEFNGCKMFVVITAETSGRYDNNRIDMSVLIIFSSQKGYNKECPRMEYLHST
jgi:hypothetical protein